MAWQPLLGLTQDEIEVECLLRDLNPTDKDNLLEVLKAEKRDPSIKPIKTHATNLKDELDQCNDQYKILTGIVSDKQNLNIEQINTVKNKFKHWQERTSRLKGRFHQDNEVDKLMNHFRRLRQLIEARAEQLQFSFVPITIYPSGSSTSLIPSVATSESKGQKLIEQKHQSNIFSLTSNDDQPANYQYVQQAMNRTTPTTQVTWTRNPDGSGMPIAILPEADNDRFSRMQASQVHFTESNVFSNVLNPCLGPVSRIDQTPNYVNYTAPQYVHSSNYTNVNVPIEMPRNTPNISFNEPLPTPFYQKRYDPKWNIQFTGLPSGLDVHDFIFRIESQAKREQIQLPMLDAILPKFLKDTAEKWYWVYARKFPNTTYFHLRQALLQRFSSTESERETRRIIETKRQKFREPVADYLLEIECLNGRLINPFSEQELVEIMRENVIPELQHVTLTIQISTIEDLRMICQKYEKLWARTTRQAPNSFTRSICSITNTTEEAYPKLTTVATSTDSYESQDNQMPLSSQIEAIYRPIQPKPVPHSIRTSVATQNFLTCWNCYDIGHRYQDCPIAPQHLFCYGCGKNGVIKPQCPQCQKPPLKCQPGANYSGQFRPANITTREQATVRNFTPSTAVVNFKTESSQRD